MSRSQSWKNLGPEGEKTVDLKRASSQPLYTPQTTASESNVATASNLSFKSSMEDMRRRIVHLNKELEQERVHSKNLKRDKAIELRQVRDEEQKKAAVMQADLKSKLHKEKMNELTSLKEQLHKEKEKEVMQIIRQKDEMLRSAQQAWAKEKDELKSKVRNELRGEAREDTKREFEKERGRLEQDIADLHRQKRELEETLKLVQGADKRKIDDIRRIHHEHEAELEKFKRNSWQESRQQMAEIRQLLNIIEQLEKKLGLEAGHSMRLRLEKDSLSDMLKKSTTFDAWDRMMSSGKSDGQATPPGTPDLKGGSQELRMLQRKNVELSSLVRKLDEKNQQLATRNAELLAELEKLEKDSRDKNRKLERKNADLLQTNKRLESRNKMLLDEVNHLKKTLTGRKENSVRPRGKANKEQDELGNLRAQMREQTRTIADLKQSLMEKDRRIELLRGRKKKSKRQPASVTSLSADFLPVTDDDALSVHSDFSEASEMSSSDDVDSKRIKKLAKELLALERAYALLQAHVGSAVDAERDEMEKQQLQSDLLESQARIHELERMMNDSGQGTGSEEMTQIQEDNKALYQKLVAAEKARDDAQGELAKYTEDMRELQGQRDLLEFELEEMSQLSTAGSEDWDSRRSRSNNGFEASPSPRMMNNDFADLSLEEIKACLEELETEKENVLSPIQQSALKQARVMLDSMAEKINHMEITESALRGKVRDLDLGYNSESLKSEFDESRSLSVITCDRETLTDLQWSELDDIESYRDQRLEEMDHLKHADLRVPTADTCCMTDLVWEDLVSMESVYKKYLNGFPEGLGADSGQFDLEKDDKECMTDFVWQDLVELEESYRNLLEDLSATDGKGKGEVEKVDNETMTDLDRDELEELERSYQRYLEETPPIKSKDDRETMTEVIWEELVEKANNDIYLSLSNEINEKTKEKEADKNEIGVTTDLVLSELAEMESKYLECIDNAREVESQLDAEKEEVVHSSVDLVETLPEVVLDTFPEDVTCTKDQCEMTELKWNDIVNLQDKCSSYERDMEQLEKKLAVLAVEKYEKSSCTEMSFTEMSWNDIINLQHKCAGYERDIEDLEKKLALFAVEKDEKSSCTEMSFTELSWNDMINLQHKCAGFERDIEDLEKKLALFAVEKDEKSVSTEMSLQDLVNARFNVEMKEAETMTDVPEILDNEALPQIVLETFPGTTETKDECDMTEGVWEEVEDLKNTYRDYRQNLEEMKHKLAQFEVEKDDKESITDIAMQDLVDLETLYKDRLHEVDSDSNSLLSHAEKESTECMTELTLIEISEMEDFYIENAASQLETTLTVEKWEQESMTDVTLDDMQYLEEVQELYRQKADSAVEKDEKCTETDLTILDVDHLQEVECAHLKSIITEEETERADKGTTTDLTMPDLELLEETGELHQSCPVQKLDAHDKEDRCVSTELTVEDLKYWEEVEAAHEECLFDREEEKKRAGIESGEKQDVEIMTEFTMLDLQYLEEVDAAHGECLQDKEEELASGKNDVEKLSVEIMTDLTVSDLNYLEDVEAAHEECLIDKQFEFETGATSAEKQNAEMMTDLTVSDLQNLEDKQERLEALSVEKQNAEMMTDLTVSDLQYLEAVESALADKQEELDARSVEKESVEIMTDLTVSDLSYLEDVEAAYEECLVDKQEELVAKEFEVEKESVEVMTDLTVSDLQYLEDVEAAHEECLVDKQFEFETGATSVEKLNAEIMTDLTVSDLKYLEGVEAAHEECLVDKQEELESSTTNVVKQNAEMMTDLTVFDLQHLEEELKARASGVEIEVMTDLTVSDLKYLEDVEAAHEECLVDKQEESEARDSAVERESVEIMTDLTVSDLQYLEDVEAAHEECLVDKQFEFETRAHSVEKQNAEMMTDLTVSDLQDLEEKQELLEALSVEKQNAEMITDLTVSDLQYLEAVESALADKQQELDARNVEKESVEIMTDLTVSDLQYLEDVEAAHEECLVDKQDELDARAVEKQNAEVMTDLTVSGLSYLEDVEAAHEECLVDKQEQSEAKTVEKEDAEIMTDLTVSDLQYLEDVEVAHEECLLDKEEQSEAKVDQKERLSVETMTDMNANDLRSLESAASDHEKRKTPKWRRWSRSSSFDHSDHSDHSDHEHEKSKTPKWRRWSRSSSLSDHRDHVQSKNTMTDMTGNILEYYEDMEVLYKETMVEFDEFKRAHSAEKEEKHVMTDVTIEDLKYLEEAETRHVEKEIEDKEIMTELAHDDLEYLMEVESLYKDSELDKESRDMDGKSDVETMTELTVSYIEYVEEEFERLKHEQSQETDSSWVVIEPGKEDKDVMTELTESELQHMEQFEVLYKESVASAAEPVSKENAEAMTDLTTADLEYFEEAENLLKKINSDGGDLSGMLAPKDDKEVITDLTSSDIDYLQVLGDIYGDENKELPGNGEVEKDDKETETELTIVDIRDLEDQLESATEMRATPSFKEFVHEDFQAETLVDLQSEMDYLPVLDEPEFILDEDEEEDFQRQDIGVMTELTLPDLEYLEANLSDGVVEVTPELVETGVQCELEDLGSLLEELSKEAEEQGEDVPSWFVTALKMRQPDGGFNPIHLVVRETDGVYALPTDEHLDVESSPKHVLEETQLARAPDDLMHLSGESPVSPGALSNEDTDADSLPFEEGDAFSKDIGIQCDIVDVLAMLAEYQRNVTDEDMPLFVSAMNMSREDTGFDPVQVHLRNRGDSSPVQDDVGNKHSNSLMVELSRPPPRDATLTVGCLPTGQAAEEEQSEFPEADTPLLASLDESDSVFNKTDESMNLPNDTEERDVLTDMPRDSSAVNRFDRFLKERKDSELLNLMALRQGIDDGGAEGAEEIKSLKELEEENELLRKQLQILESAKGAEDLEKENTHLKEKLKQLEESDNTEELEKENALLKERVESLNDIEEENNLLKEEVEILRQSTALEDIEEENALLKDKIKMLEELAVSEQDIKKIEEENDELREKVKTLEETAGVSELDMKKTEKENEELKEKIETLVESMNTEELETENDYLKQQIAMLAAEPERVKELEEENEILQEKIQALEASANVVINENALLKEQIEVLEENERVQELKDENDKLKEKVQILEESSTNVEDLVNENALLKEQVEIMEETGRVKELEDENEMLKEKVQILEESTNVEDLVNENALLKEQIEIMEETGRVKELEDENEMLKEKVQILEESSAAERLEHEQLMEKIQDLEQSTGRVVEKLEEENVMLKENIQILEDSTSNMKDLENENALLRGKIESLYSSSNIQELKEENASLKEKIRSLEESAGKDSSKEDFELLQQKIEQLKEAEKKIAALNESNVALRERIDLLQKEKENMRDNSSEMDTSEQLGKELEKLKQENKELYEELMELRRKVQEREIAERLNEATQTEHGADLGFRSRDVISPVPSSVEETITPRVRSTVASEVRYLGDSRLELELSPRVSYIPVKSSDFEGKDDFMDYPGIVGESVGMPSYHENARDSDELISEPQLMSSRRDLDSYMDDIDQRIQDLRYIDREGQLFTEDRDGDRPRTETSDLVGFDSDDDGDLPPLPESSPPPLPFEPPPDLPDSSPPVFDDALEVLLRSESSPPRDAATLRASSRQRFRSDSKPSSELSVPSSRVESPVPVEETTLMLESEPSELGGMYPEQEPLSSSVRRPTGLGSTKPLDSTTKAPPQVLPKPKRILLQKRQPGPLNQPMVSYVDSNASPPLTSQWSRDEEDGVIPPRGIVQNRAASINRGEIDALNEKIGFLERQLQNKENLIRSMKTEATELETQSLLERKDREMKILDEDVAFLKQENQKKERELLTKIGEMNKKNYEIEQWKAEANNSERQRQRMEAAYMNLQNQLKSLQGAELKLAELQTKYSGMEKQNFELSEKVKKLERTEREFKKLEQNIQLLQAQVQEMDIVEQDRNHLVEKMKTVENQRDDLLRKGRVVESERNDFLRNNKLMEMQKDDLENRCAILQKTNTTLNSRLAELEQDLKVAQTKMHDSQHERNFLQVQLDKMDKERNEMQTRLAITTQERNSLENQVAELQDLNRDHVKLEDGFHSLRIKLAESNRQKDDAEMQIPTLKAKISLLKRACKEKDELVDKLSEEIRELRHSIATSALDDMSKIRSYGYSPKNFVKLSAQREQERKIAKRHPEDLVEERLQSRLEKQSPRRSPKSFEPSPPGTKKAKRFVALFDYDPYKSPACEHPELELKLKEGDFLTVFGDMDINGYFEADVNGVRGLVPSLYVEEVEDDNDADLALEEYLSRSRRDPLKDVPSHKASELQLYRDNTSSGHCTPSSGASSAGSEPRQCMVALHDYDPFHSGVSGRPSRDQLSLKKGDIMTAFGDMDVNGFYRVDLNGQTGFVPGHVVEEVSSSSFLQPTSSRAPEQILGMLDNIQVRGQPKASSTHMLTPPGGITNGFPSPTQALGNFTPPSHVRLPSDLSTPPSHVHLPGNLSTPPNHVRLPGHLSTPPSHLHLPGNLSTPPSHVHLPGGPSSPLPNVGLTRFKPSPEVAMLGPLNNSAVVPVTSTQSSSVAPQKQVKASLPPAASKQIVPVVSNKSRSKKVRPSPPSNFRIIRPVNHDAMLVGWTLPEMDEFGRNNGLTVKGYKIYASSDVKLEVRSPYMAKALVEDLELHSPIKFSIKTVAENGSSSETVSATFSDTIKASLLDSYGESFEDSGDEQQYRTFVALYDYDPFKSSPNPNPATELGFKEGDILRVFDTSRKDGFYVGKLKNKKGLIPSNFVEEVAVASPRRLAAAKKRQAALPSPTRPFSGGSSSSGGGGSPAVLTKNPVQLRKKMMVALYDYNPEVQSPQDNPDSELSFRKGQTITVVGEMRADGFYHADVNGQLGLVPGSFLDERTDGETDSGLESGRRVAFGRSQRLLEGLSRT
ncbi:uncharacterized protein LOC144643107 isoform X2 [Oculina patagonica]